MRSSRSCRIAQTAGGEAANHFLILELWSESAIPGGKVSFDAENWRDVEARERGKGERLQQRMGR